MPLLEGRDQSNIRIVHAFLTVLKLTTVPLALTTTICVGLWLGHIGQHLDSAMWCLFIYVEWLPPLDLSVFFSVCPFWGSLSVCPFLRVLSVGRYLCVLNSVSFLCIPLCVSLSVGSCLGVLAVSSYLGVLICVCHYLCVCVLICVSLWTWTVQTLVFLKHLKLFLLLGVDWLSLWVVTVEWHYINVWN